MKQDRTWAGVVIAGLFTLGLGAVAILDAQELLTRGHVALAVVAVLFVPVVAVAGWSARGGYRDQLFLVFYSYFTFSAARTAFFKLQEGRTMSATFLAAMAVTMLVAITMLGLEMVRKSKAASPSVDRP